MQLGKRVLVCAHGNSIRAIIKHLDNVSESEITELNIPTGVPLVYELDASFKPIKHYYLANEDELKKKMEAVAN
jgi:2,3-bisphosphoglycerate-dependent phosphoglycerate mutase